MKGNILFMIRRYIYSFLIQHPTLIMNTRKGCLNKHFRTGQSWKPVSEHMARTYVALQPLHVGAVLALHVAAVLALHVAAVLALHVAAV